MERSRRVERALLIGLVAMGLALVALVAWIRVLPPVSEGSVVAWLGDADPIPCDAPAPDGEGLIDCHQVPFAEGAGVGIGFTVRNTAPLPMTIVAVEALEPPLLTPAYLRPEQVQDDGGFLFGLDAGRPFEPIEVAPNGEAALQLVGSYLDCETAAASHPSGSSLVLDRARMTLRWAFVETDVVVPLRGALSMPGPISCPDR